MSADQDPDPVDAAIAATEPTRTVEMMGIPGTIASTGRPFRVDVPADMTEAELIEVTGWMLTQLATALRQRREQTPLGRILIPGRA